MNGPYKQLFFYRMESLQLRNIKNIQNSLSLLKLKIENMSKLNSQKEEALDKLILSTIPLVEKKMKENEIKEHMEMKRTFYQQRSNSLKKKNEESRLINEKEISRSRQLLTLMKQHNSLHLKESKKHNEEKIKQIKEINLNKKRERKLQVKKREQQSQAKIQQFHIQKQSDLKLKRIQETKQNQQKIECMMNKLRDLAQKEMLMQQKIRSSEENITKFKKVINKVERMKCDQFNKFRQEVAPSPEHKSNSKSISEAILLYAAHSK